MPALIHKKICTHCIHDSLNKGGTILVKVGDPDSVFCWETAVNMLIYSAAVYEEETSSRRAECANPVQAQGSLSSRAENWRGVSSPDFLIATLATRLSFGIDSDMLYGMHSS